MDKKTIFSLLLILISVASCAPKVALTPTQTPYLTKTPLPTQGIISPLTSVPASAANEIFITLPLATDFQTEVTYPPCKPVNDGYLPASKTGCMYISPFVTESTQIDLGNSFQVVVKIVDEPSSLVTIVKNGKEVYKTQAFRYTSYGLFSGLITAWGYGNHWAIEITTPSGLDVIQDGESIKAKNNYVVVCGFQILSGKPFYLFKKLGVGYGANYDGILVNLDYDEIACNADNPKNEHLIKHYQNMVDFSIITFNYGWKSTIIATFEK
jgi:hypothetical protein